MKISLPWPPSTNTYWRHLRSGALAGRTLLSAKGRRYRKDVWEVISRGVSGGFGADDRLQLTIWAYPPDKRVRDLDNILKSLLDSLVHAGVLHDDSLVDWLTVIRMGQVKGGRVDLECCIDNRAQWVMRKGEEMADECR